MRIVQVRGHMRRTPTGKMVYVKPHIRRLSSGYLSAASDKYDYRGWYPVEQRKYEDDTFEHAVQIVNNYVKDLREMVNDPDKVDEFLDGALSIEAHVDMDTLEPKDFEILLGYGGPNVWMNVADGRITVTWGAEKIVAKMDDPEAKEALEALFDYLEEIYKASFDRAPKL